jgi:hypothetical protein
VAASLVATWQRDQKPEVLDQILEAARPVWTGAILARNGYSADFDELPSAAKVKIWRKIAKYDSKKKDKLDDLNWRIYQVRTVCIDEHELRAQRWLVERPAQCGIHAEKARTR